MTETATIDLLNELLREEQKSVAPRLIESTVFIAQSAGSGLFELKRMAGATREHIGLLTNLIFELGGTPGPRSLDLGSADLHFQELRHVLPRLEADLHRLSASYTRAMGRANKNAHVLQVLQTLQAHHAESLRRLQQSMGSRQGAAQH